MSNVTQLETLAAVFRDRVIQRNDAPALHFVCDGQTVTKSWQQLGADVYRWTSALNKLGVTTGTHVVHWSENRWEWVITDLALNCLGAVHVPIHSTLSGRQTVDQIIHSEAAFAIISGPSMLDQLQPFQNELNPQLRLISYEPLRNTGTQNVPDFAQLMTKGDPEHGEQITNATAAHLDPTATTTILYTSGTTGEPKGIMLSQRNLVSNAAALANNFADEPLALRLNFLPFSHIFGRTCDLYTWVTRGEQLALTQSRETIIDDCKRFKPTVINGVPFFFERVRQKIEEKGQADEPGVLLRVFGGSLLGCFSGGGPLSRQTYDYYQSQGIPLMQGYGLTESSPVISFSSFEHRRAGTSGPRVPGVEIHIAEDGEILTKGPHVMLGYWKNETATREAFKDGWLHTGDLGHLDDDGHLTITGRKKETIVMSTGKNVVPSHIEDLLCRDPLILQAVVFGEGRSCLSALLVPDPAILKAEIKKRRIWVFSRRGAVRNKRVRQLYRERIDRQLADLAHHEQVPLFTVLDHGFTIESGHMTAKLSLRRMKIAADYAGQIEAMYGA
jgi:long-chain acyl-CoA synthetase